MRPASAPEGRPLAEMNVTPLIDVLLVLLIMFIITIPLQTHAVKIDLPADCPSCPKVAPNVNLVTISPAGQIAWNGSLVSLRDFATLLRTSQQMQPTPELHLKPASAAEYGRVDEVLAAIKREHVRKFGFVGNEAHRDLF